MSVYAVTFRVEDRRTSKGDYEHRYESLMQAIRSLNPQEYWEETTSFVLIESTIKNSAAVKEHILRMSDFDPSCDLAVVVNLSEKGSATLGNPQDQDLEKILKKR